MAKLLPLLFEADSQESIQAAHVYAKQLGHQQHSTERNPLHLEKDVSTQTVHSSNGAPNTSIIEDLQDTASAKKGDLLGAIPV